MNPGINRAIQDVIHFNKHKCFHEYSFLNFF